MRRTMFGREDVQLSIRTTLLSLALTKAMAILPLQCKACTRQSDYKLFPHC